MVLPHMWAFAQMENLPRKDSSTFQVFKQWLFILFLKSKMKFSFSVHFKVIC